MSGRLLLRQLIVVTWWPTWIALCSISMSIFINILDNYICLWRHIFNWQGSWLLTVKYISRVTWQHLMALYETETGELKRSYLFLLERRHVVLYTSCDAIWDNLYSSSLLIYDLQSKDWINTYYMLKGFPKACRPSKVSNKMKCTNEKMIWNTQDRNLISYVSKAIVDHTISGQGTYQHLRPLGHHT